MRLIEGERESYTFELSPVKFDEQGNAYRTVSVDIPIDTVLDFEARDEYQEWKEGLVNSFSHFIDHPKFPKETFS
jgi:hypothetical protein